MSTEPTVEERIIHCLIIYPVISPSMLQVGIGTNISPIDWKPILKKLIESGRVLETAHDTKTLSGRFFSYAQLRLVK